VKLDICSIGSLLDNFSQYGIIPESARNHLLNIANNAFLFSPQLATAESIHLHIKVPSTEKLPHKELSAYGGIAQNEKEGYIKYAFPSHINLIFSSIPVSQEEKAGIASFVYPHLDHIGIDIRKNDEESYKCFNTIPLLAKTANLPCKRQGGDGKQVFCCHVQVNEKYWVYAPYNPYLEFAFGALIVSEDVFGCDLRPADPALGLWEEKVACCTGMCVPVNEVIVTDEIASPA
jgi:hypothetical protein